MCTAKAMNWIQEAFDICRQRALAWNAKVYNNNNQAWVPNQLGPAMWILLHHSTWSYARKAKISDKKFTSKFFMLHLHYQFFGFSHWPCLASNHFFHWGILWTTTWYNHRNSTPLNLSNSESYQTMLSSRPNIPNYVKGDFTTPLKPLHKECLI